MHEVYLNGSFVPLAEAKVSVLDRGFLFGDGIYELIPAYGGRPLRPAAHLARLRNSLDGIGMAAPLSDSDWPAVFERLLAAAPDADQSLYIQITRGAAPSRDHRFPTAAVPPTVLAMTKPLAPRNPALLTTGATVILRDDIRWLRCDIKAIALLANVMLREAAHQLGAEEALLVRDGNVVEGSTSNLFIVRDGLIITPPNGPLLLPGVTRDLTLELAAGAGMALAEQPVPLSDLLGADEVWLTSSTREVMPVTRVDDQPVGNGQPGPVWRRMDALYQDCKAQLRGHRRG